MLNDMNTQWKEIGVNRLGVRFIDEVRERQAARAAHRQLRDELATYTNLNEISDLLSAVTRLGADENDEVRRILERNLAERQRSSLLAS